MRVNITYTEELENIPALLSGFVAEVAQGLVMQASETNDTKPLVESEGYSLQAIQKIDKIRVELARLDSRLEDVMNMLGGLHNHAMGNTPPVSEQAEQEVNDDGNDEQS